MTSDLISSSRNGFLVPKNYEKHTLHGYIWVKNKKDINDFEKTARCGGHLGFLQMALKSKPMVLSFIFLYFCVSLFMLINIKPNLV